MISYFLTNFSRISISPLRIEQRKFNGKINYYRQLGLIGFTRQALLRFVELAPSELEIIESVDMNRFLENGTSILINLSFMTLRNYQVLTQKELLILKF